MSPGGVGSGLYGMLLFAVVAVFIAGLMIGRTPEYLGKTIRAREVKLAMIGVLIMPAGLLITLGIAVVVHAGGIGALQRAARTASPRSSTRSRRSGTTTARRSAG